MSLYYIKCQLVASAPFLWGGGNELFIEDSIFEIKQQKMDQKN